MVAASRGGTWHRVCPASELPPGTRRLVTVGRRSVGVFNVGGRHYALRNVCPHMGGPLCLGTVGGAMLPSRPYEYVFAMEDRVLRCPWHGWAFDLETGRALFGIADARVRTYRVRVAGGDVEVEL
jgi:3-phenylpropionate/trans-cinnamate dioxygenase ferredoxin subunit